MTDKKPHEQKQIIVPKGKDENARLKALREAERVQEQRKKGKDDEKA